MARTHDLTEGKPIRLILSFCIPTMLGFLFQQLYNIADTAIVGRTLGAEMLGAVGCTWSLNFLVLGFCMGTCSGFAIPLAQCFGARDRHSLRKNLYNSIWICLFMAGILTVITAIACPAMLRFMNTPEDILDAANSYLRVIFIGIPATMLYNMCCCVLRSLGDSRTPVFFLVLASLINVALDFVTILVFHMGVRGAAIATVTSQLLSGIGCLTVLMKKFPILKGTAEEKKFRPDVAKRLIAIGCPMGLQFSITAIGTLVVQFAVNGLGTSAISALSAGNRVGNIFTCAYDALASTITTFAGQNIGAKKPGRVSEGVKAASLLGIVYSLLTMVILWLFGPFFISLFIDPGESKEVVDMASYFLRFSSCFYIALMFVNVLRLAIQGMGYTRDAMLAGLFETVARVVVSLFLVPSLAYTGVCMAHPAAWVMACLYLFPCYFAKIKKEKERCAPQSAEAPAD